MVTREQVDTWVATPNVAVYFTDGSSRGNPGRAGSAALRVVASKTEKDIGYEPLPSQSFEKETNNVAELVAIQLVLNQLEQREEKRVRIMTDSKYAHGLLQLQWRPQKNVQLVRTMRTQIRRLKNKGYIVSLHWVKAHTSQTLPWNSIVDKMAVKAATESRDTS